MPTTNNAPPSATADTVGGTLDVTLAGTFADRVAVFAALLVSQSALRERETRFRRDGDLGDAADVAEARAVVCGLVLAVEAGFTPAERDVLLRNLTAQVDR